MPLLALPASWVRLVPGYTPSPLLVLLLEQLGRGLGQEEEEEGEKQQQQQQQQAPPRSSSSLATTWWEVTLQVLARAAEAGIHSADTMAADPNSLSTASEYAASAAAVDTSKCHLVPSPAALPFWAPLARLAVRFVKCSRRHWAQQQVQQRVDVLWLSIQLRHAALGARHHPTTIATYAVPSRSPAADPWALYGAVCDLGLRLGRLEQQVGVYAALAQHFRQALQQLEPMSQVRRKLWRAGQPMFSSMAYLERGLAAAASSHLVLLRSWEVGARQALTQLWADWDDFDDSSMCSSQYEEEEEVEEAGNKVSAPQQQQQQSRPAPSAAGATGEEAGAAAQQSGGGSSRRRLVAKRQQQQPPDARLALDGLPGGNADPIRWMEPGGRSFFSWTHMPPAAAGMTADLAANVVCIATHKEWVASRLASQLLVGVPTPRWCGELQSIQDALEDARDMRLDQLDAAVGQQQVPDEKEDMWDEDEDEGQEQEQPSDPSRRSQEPPLDPAHVLAAAQACFGALRELGSSCGRF
jgi:hypothetical protein